MTVPKKRVGKAKRKPVIKDLERARDNWHAHYDNEYKLVLKVTEERNQARASAASWEAMARSAQEDLRIANERYALADRMLAVAHDNSKESSGLASAREFELISPRGKIAERDEWLKQSEYKLGRAKERISELTKSRTICQMEVVKA